MNTDSYKELGERLAKETEDRISIVTEEAKKKIDDEIVRFQTYEADARSNMEERLHKLEDNMSRTLAVRIFVIVGAAVSVGAAAMYVSSATATRDVNASVIALQKDIISAQTTIKDSNDALMKQGETQQSTFNATLNSLDKQKSDVAEAETKLRECHKISVSIFFRN